MMLRIALGSKLASLRLVFHRLGQVTWNRQRVDW